MANLTVVVAGGAAPVARWVELDVAVDAPDALELSWTALPDRDPVAAGDAIGVWDGVPDGAPIATQPVGATAGSAVLGGLQLQRPYTVGYTAGPGAGGANVAAARAVSSGTVAPAAAVTVNLGALSTGSVTVDYTAPPWQAPAALGHRLWLLAGSAAQPGVEPLATTAPGQDPSGQAVFDGVKLTGGATYTVAYLVGADPANLAATITFAVA